MTARDAYHNAVVKALEKDGWILLQLSIPEYHVKLLIFDPNKEVIVEWKN